MSERDPAAEKPASRRPRSPPTQVFASAITGGICVVGIGASAGGLEASKRFLGALPAGANMAFILIQHMDPTHESMMVELLGKVSPIPVVQATDDMMIEPDHVYVIPPGVYLAVRDGAMHLSPPQERHGARMPFDFLLHSLAISVGSRAVCVILSGSGADGSVGLQAIKAAGGLVIVEAPEEAGYDGMPRSAIATGQVDRVLPVEEMGAALISHRKSLDGVLSHEGLTRIIDLLRVEAGHDFTAYKSGTLERRIARRMGIAGIEIENIDGYLKLLHDEKAEREALATDLLINVTSFFRDPKTFEILAAGVIPELIKHAGDAPLRLWIAGCSSGEETYSLAILFQEKIQEANSDAKLQIFASDVDAAAVMAAREGLYPATIEAQVSPARLARFFKKDERGYRVSPDVRSLIVFAVHDVLADPPFAKLDFISCRNLLIYLRPQAQARIIALFNFALRKDGILLLGSAETVGAADGRFAILSKSAKLYRKVGNGSSGDVAVQAAGAEGRRSLLRVIGEPVAGRGADIADFTKRLVLDSYAPAAILINYRLECLYLSGPTELYVRVAPGYPTLDVLAMLRPPLRVRVKAAIDEAIKTNAAVAVPGGRVVRDGTAMNFNIDVKPVQNDADKLLLICFLDQPLPARTRSEPAGPQDPSMVKDLEQELAAVRRDLKAALHSVETSAQEQSAVNEEALSINEEYQSTNEELLTSKEELQSLNEELTALNSQLQETLERSRMTSNDLQNVLYSTDVATLFLDRELNIRFFTPATRALFTLIQGDIGRPLTDLHALSTDDALHKDALAVLSNALPLEREVQTENGTWFNRRVLPYRAHDNGVEGVVITFTDITERRNIAASLLAAQRSAEQANVAKSRFLAAASHDLRQPMQTLALLNGLLGRTIETVPARTLLKKLDDTTAAMTSILNTLLDINQIDAGIIQADFVSTPVNELLKKIHAEFTDIAASRGLTLKMVPCSLFIRTDPRILEQILRNLVSNALKYTTAGGVLLGCRRHGAHLGIEIWDTGLGIPPAELTAIFEEYHQINNAGRQRSGGLGLGLSIVQRLAELLKHKITVRSIHRKGSVFAVEAEIVQAPPAQRPHQDGDAPASALPPAIAIKGRILVIEDDPDIRQLFEIFVREEGHQVAVAPDGVSAAALIEDKSISPDLILADYNLPNGDDGLEVVMTLQRLLAREVAVIIVTGDISTETMRRIALTSCVQMTKPMKLAALNEVIQASLRATARAAALPPVAAKAPVPHGREAVYVIDDDPAIRETMRDVFEAEGLHVEVFADGESFMKTTGEERSGCVLVDAQLPGMSGHQVLALLPAAYPKLRAIMITGVGDIKAAVRAMQKGAVDFIEKPIQHAELLACVSRVFELTKGDEQSVARQEDAASRIASLTARQRQVMELVLAGQASKIIAADLGISQRTVENHRASIMEKTGTRSIPDLVRVALLAASG